MIQLIHVDDEEAVQDDAGELDKVRESGVHSIESPHECRTDPFFFGTNEDWLLLRCHS